MQVSRSVLRSDGFVVWVGKSLVKHCSASPTQPFLDLIMNVTDASSNLVGSRLMEIISGSQNKNHTCSSPVSAEKSDEYLNNFHHFITPTLPHLLALLTHQSTGFPPSNTSIIVIDAVATLFALAFPKTMQNTNSQQTPAKRSDATQWASSRRWAVMGDFISKIGRLAATRNIAILITNQTNTRIRSETGAMLHPAVSGTAWDSGIRTCVVLFRDWLFQPNDASSSQGNFVPGVRFAGVMRVKGVAYEGVGKVVAFGIEKVSIVYPQFTSPLSILGRSPRNFNR